MRVKQYFSGLSKNTVLLAIASLFADISTEMLYPVLPTYLTQVLKASGSIVGVVEGVATATQNAVQGLSGWLSDRLQNRKHLAIGGYTLAALAKPLIGASATPFEVLGARFLDRFGTGVRSAPRDALIASSADTHSRGKAFGLEGIGDNLGAFVGPLIAVALLYFLHVQLRMIFYLTIIPGLLAIGTMLLLKEQPREQPAPARTIRPAGRFPRTYWTYLLVTGLFGLGNSSNAFLLLQSRNVGIPLTTTVLIYASYNLVAALVSYPLGAISDGFGRKYSLLFAFLIYVITYLGFALIHNPIMVGGLFILYGGFQGIYRTVGKAFASDFVPPALHGSSIGWYSMIVGITGLAASIIAGMLWDRSGPVFVFLFSAVFATIGALALFFLIPNTRHTLSEK